MTFRKIINITFNNSFRIELKMAGMAPPYPIVRIQNQQKHYGRNVVSVIAKAQNTHTYHCPVKD